MSVLARCAEAFGYLVGRLSVLAAPLVALLDRHWRRRADAIQLDTER